MENEIFEELNKMSDSELEEIIEKIDKILIKVEETGEQNEQN